MSETETEIRYGLVGPETAETFPGGKGSEGLSVKVFEEDEDGQWCTGIITRRYRSGRVHAQAKTELQEMVKEARNEGRVPFRVAGSPERVPKFLQETGITLMELVN